MNPAGPIPTAQELLMFEEIGPDRFRACFNLDNYTGAAFGGQLLGQALAAACATVADWPAASLNGFFFRAGKLDAPIDYVVERVSEGRRFASRQVTAHQHDRPIFGLQCSFHKPEDGAAHQSDVADLSPPPEKLPSLPEFARACGDRLPDVLRELFNRPFPIEMRPLRPDSFLTETDRDLWIRAPSGAAVVGSRDHQALLAMMSDYWLPGAIIAQHSRDRRSYSVTSLNHSLWFHGPVRADEWLLYQTRSHWSGNGRGLARGLIFDREGRLVATA
ncbi:MAG TPA: acyl-CoA thioesterase domain-containing protein, partial [Sphingobium sp.]